MVKKSSGYNVNYIRYSYTFLLSEGASRDSAPRGVFLFTPLYCHI